MTHDVQIIYKPQKNSMESDQELISFSTKENAIEFAKRQNNLDAVSSARYLGKN